MRNRKRKKRQRSTFLWFIIFAGSVILIDTFYVTLHITGWLIGTVAIGAGCWLMGRRTAPAAVESRILTRSNIEIQRLTRELASAKESAHIAWDATSKPRASRKARPEIPQRDALINDPRSGIQPLGNSE